MSSPGTIGGNLVLHALEKGIGVAGRDRKKVPSALCCMCLLLKLSKSGAAPPCYAAHDLEALRAFAWRSVEIGKSLN